MLKELGLGRESFYLTNGGTLLPAEKKILGKPKHEYSDSDDDLKYCLYSSHDSANNSTGSLPQTDSTPTALNNDFSHATGTLSHRDSDKKIKDDVLRPSDFSNPQ
jgi:hypothetical protein